MVAVENIPITIESQPQGNSLPILHEIRHAIERFLRSGETTVLDLKSIPFAPGDEDVLLTQLGEGEVTATIQSLGQSHIRECSFPGVWIVEHLNSEEERIAFQLEIGEIPALLKSQERDIADGLDALSAALSNFETATTD